MGNEYKLLIYESAGENGQVPRDVEVSFNNRKYFGTFVTPEIIRRMMEGYVRTGENAKGSYFCAKNLVIVKDFDKKTIQDSLEDLIRRGDIDLFLGD